MDIRIDTNLAELHQWIDGNVLKQMKFATSVALYDTAKEAQTKLREELPRHFTIRTDWVAKGIRIKPGSSRGIRNSGDGLNGMEVEIGTVDMFMRLHELGGTKEPKRKTRRMGIPKRDDKGEIIDKSKWPKALLKKPGYFMWTRPIDGRTFVFHRAQKSRYPIELKYSFAESVKIPQRWNMRETVENIADTRYLPIFAMAFDKAMATAK